MHPSQLIVTSMPLNKLWDRDGLLQAHRVRPVGKEEIADLLRSGSTFVVADVGHPLRWIVAQDRFNFWKIEVKEHLASPETDDLCLKAYPNEYCYIASEWRCAGSIPVVLLEKHH
jgi:hypothetical protein